METSSPRFSVVVPVFNAAAFLERCLDSLLAQTDGGWEAVCVDDGSSDDDSAAILAEYASRDARIKVIRQDNRGTHVARQVAVAAATGGWCLFLDPDDWLEADALARLSSVLDRTAADVVSYGFVVHAAEDRVKSVAAALDRQFNPPPRTFGRDEFFSAVFVAHDVPGHLIGKVVRADVCKRAFGAMRDRRMLFQEDLCALYRIVAESAAAETVADRLYNYRVGDGISYRANMSCDEYFGTFTKFDELRDLRGFCAERFAAGSAAERALKGLEVRMALASVSAALERLENPEDGREGVRRLREICSDEVLSAALAQWYRLKGDRLADAARWYGLGDLLGDVALRQLDHVWRGHNSRLRGHDHELETLRGEISALKEEADRLREVVAGLQAASSVSALVRLPAPPLKCG